MKLFRVVFSKMSLNSLVTKAIRRNSSGEGLNWEFIRPFSGIFPNFLMVSSLVGGAILLPSCRTPQSGRGNQSQVLYDPKGPSYDESVGSLANVAKEIPSIPNSSKGKPLPFGQRAGIVVAAAPSGPLGYYPTATVYALKDYLKEDFFRRIEQKQPLFFISIVFSKSRVPDVLKNAARGRFESGSDEVLGKILNEAPDTLKGKFSLTSAIDNNLLFCLDEYDHLINKLALPLKMDNRKSLPVRVVAKDGRVSEIFQIPSQLKEIKARLDYEMSTGS